MARRYNLVGGKFASLSMQDKYEAYLNQYNKKADRFSMAKSYNFEQFQSVYKEVYNAYVEAGEKPNNIIRSVVSEQQLTSRSLAIEMKQKLGGKVSDYYKLENSQFVNEEIKSYMEEEVIGTNPTTGDPWKYKRTRNQAITAWLVDNKIINSGDEYWGY